MWCMLSRFKNGNAEKRRSKEKRRFLIVTWTYYLCSHVRCAYCAKSAWRINSFRSSGAGTGTGRAVIDSLVTRFFTGSHIRFRFSFFFVCRSAASVSFPPYTHSSEIFLLWDLRLFFLLLWYFREMSNFVAIQWNGMEKKKNVRCIKRALKQDPNASTHILWECRKWSFTFTIYCEKIETKRFDFHEKINRRTKMLENK